MLTTTVSVFSFITMAIAALCGIIIPVGMMIFIKRKFDCKVLPFFAGCFSFFTFAVILEGLINFVISTSSFGEVLISDKLMFALYGGFMAAIFEETGRFIVMHFLKKNNPDDSTALMYGAGHAGLEIVLVIVVGMVSNIVLGVMINTGKINDMLSSYPAEQIEGMKQTISVLCNTSPWIYLVSIFERISAVIFHLGASVLVWFSVKNKKLVWLYPVAILLHMLLDFISSYSAAMNISVVLIEISVFAMSCLVALFARFIWKKYSD